MSTSEDVIFVHHDKNVRDLRIESMTLANTRPKAIDR